MIEAYNEGLKEFNKGDIFFAAKKFNEVELLYPQSIWAPRSILMAAYSYYSQMYFTDAIIEIEGDQSKEVLKKGCPFNFNILEKNNSINSTYNGIAFTVDMIDDNPFKVRIFTLRSFGESLYHSITDSSLEFGFKSI